MTKYYGSKVGTPRQATPPAVVGSGLANSPDVVLMRDTIELSAAAANDTVQLAKLPWETILSPASRFWFDDLGTGNTVSIGDVTYATALVNAQDTATAASGADGIAMLKSVDLASYFKPLWQMLGYATLAAAQAVGAQCELLAKVGSAAATGTLTWQILGHPQ